MPRANVPERTVTCSSVGCQCGAILYPAGILRRTTKMPVLLGRAHEDVRWRLSFLGLGSSNDGYKGNDTTGNDTSHLTPPCSCSTTHAEAAERADPAPPNVACMRLSGGPPNGRAARRPLRDPGFLEQEYTPRL